MYKTKVKGQSLDYITHTVMHDLINKGTLDFPPQINASPSTKPSE